MPTLVTITDIDDPRLEGYRDLRDPDRTARSGTFVAESRLVLDQLVASGRYPVLSVLTTPARLEAMRGSLERLPADTPVYVVDAAQMAAVAGFRIHRGCLALGSRGAVLDAETVLTLRPSTLLVLESVTDPDNVGSLFRSGRALGVDALLLGTRCADPLYRKAIRTSMGAVFHLPWGRYDDVGALARRLREAGVTIAALTPAPMAVPIAGFVGALRQDAPVALMVGNEGVGLSANALAASDVHVRVPMRPGTDSLNAHVSAAIALSHLGRARQASSET